MKDGKLRLDDGSVLVACGCAVCVVIFGRSLFGRLGDLPSVYVGTFS